jgi:hypothetical protein
MMALFYNSFIYVGTLLQCPPMHYCMWRKVFERRVSRQRHDTWRTSGNNNKAWSEQLILTHREQLGPIFLLFYRLSSIPFFLFRNWGPCRNLSVKLGCFWLAVFLQTSLWQLSHGVRWALCIFVVQEELLTTYRSHTHLSHLLQK